MNKKEFAELIASEINGVVCDVPKPNGIVRTGITVGDGKIRPTIYIDSLYEQGMSVSQAVKEVMNIMQETEKSTPQINLDWFTDYAQVKGKLVIRLYNEKTQAEVFWSAKDWGFDDLILIPYVQLNKEMSVKATKEIMSTWGVTEDQLFADAWENTSKIKEFKVQSMRDTLIELMGPGAEMMLPPTEMSMITVTSTDKMFGAIGAIIMHEEIERRCPNGYWVIPSSVHECIIIPADSIDDYSLHRMISDVNDGQVALEEQLGDHGYLFNPGEDANGNPTWEKGGVNA